MFVWLKKCQERNQTDVSIDRRNRNTRCTAVKKWQRRPPEHNVTDKPNITSSLSCRSTSPPPHLCQRATSSRHILVIHVDSRFASECVNATPVQSLGRLQTVRHKAEHLTSSHRLQQIVLRCRLTGAGPSSVRYTGCSLLHSLNKERFKPHAHLIEASKRRS